MCVRARIEDRELVGMNASNSAEVVIVGGGIAGCSLAYYLAAAGVEDILVVEAATLGSGATAHSMGGVRQQFSTSSEIENSKRALKFWRTVEEAFEAPCEFYEEGYLLLTERPALADRLVQAAQLQKRLGAGPAQVLTGEDLLEVAPWLHITGDTTGCHTPQDGRVNPTDGLTALVGAGRRLGVRFAENWLVERITIEPDLCVSGPDDVVAGLVVVTAGIQSPALVSSLGVDLAITPQNLHYASTGPALAGQSVPVTIDLDTGLFVERNGPGLVISVLHENSPPTYTAEDMLTDFATAATSRAPALLDAGVISINSAAADLSVDGHPYAGQLAEGLWVLAGFAGHGTMHAPVVAQSLAQAMAGRSTTIDLAAMDPWRTPAESEWLVGSRKA